MATVIPFSADDPVEQVTLEHDGIWLSALLLTDGTVILSDDAGELHRYRYFGRKSDTPAVIDSVETTIASLEWEHGPIRDWITGGTQ